eukprot:CAMPEP_0113655098 /NCGR_PEP_ID=MMETSP0017_2-20120614/29511_1 /TAXON_ID=2856 /ORGANISM="Cylindrotheca closterium" /LENGTH=350 /DNA_ID=CAMNT_0000568295 /DNA_START=100 /DNA_END=1152 /DNA_ORIENTATION=+ /assembly_acc=CAM_ASM_000147
MVKQNLRYDTEVRQIGGIMMVLAMSLVIYPLFDTSDRLSDNFPDNDRYNGDDGGLAWALLCGNVAIIVLGLLGMAIGFMALTEAGHKYITVVGLVWQQTAFVDWVAKMYELAVTMGIDENPSSTTEFYFSMGILKMFFLKFMQYGSLAVTLFTLFAFQSRKGHLKNAAYYRKRLVIYSFFFAANGIFGYLVPGAKVYLDNEDNLPVKKPIKPLVVFVGQPITVPEITLAMGAIFALVGVYGMARGLGLAQNDNRYFQIAVAVAYIAYLGAVVLTEFSIGGRVAGAMAAGVEVINCHIILSFLDQKAKTMPEEMDEDYFHDDAIVTKFGQERARKLKKEKEEETVEAEGMA